ncbi:MAG: alpha/beta fold hydrolase [Rhodospirillaceae bacterium]|nr:alpha/beta fold hydrolase [Rhodospirillaceae bacterium]
MRKGYIDTPVGQVHYREHGSGQPIVLLHQTAWSSIQYKYVMPALAERGLRCIAIDTPGYGMSDGFSKPPAIPDYADILRHAMDGLGLKSAHVAAHHTGVSIAISLAARFPERVERLALHGVPLYTPEEREVRLARPHFDQTPKPDGSHLQKRFEISVKMSPGASLEAIHQSTVQFYMAGPLEWYGHHAAFEYDSAADLMKIKAPTLIMSNTGDTLHVVAERIKKIRPDFSYAVMEGGTYHIVYDEAPAWAKVVADFVLGAKA